MEYKMPISKLAIRLALGAALIALPTTAAQAQTAPILVTVVAACGTPPSTYSAGQNRAATMDTTGAFCTGSSVSIGAVSITAVTPVVTSALAANLVVKASAGSLHSFDVSADSTLSAAPWWVMIYNLTSAPSDGAVTPTKCYALPSGATSIGGAFVAPVTFTTGIVIGVSTTGCFSKTASTHAFISAE